jgi:hypothetical protein
MEISLHYRNRTMEIFPDISRKKKEAFLPDISRKKTKVVPSSSPGPEASPTEISSTFSAKRIKVVVFHIVTAAGFHTATAAAGHTVTAAACHAATAVAHHMGTAADSHSAVTPAFHMATAVVYPTARAAAYRRTKTAGFSVAKAAACHTATAVVSLTRIGSAVTFRKGWREAAFWHSCSRPGGRMVQKISCHIWGTGR